jgi:hypothetical protein
MKKKKEIIDLEEQRMGLFMNNNSFDLDIMYGRNFLETDNIQTVIIHRINIIESVSHSLYGQSKPKDKKYLPPVRISAVVTIETGKQEFYGNNPGGIVRDDSGPITLGVYLKELEEKQLEINRGDIIQYNMSGEKNRYYEVENANNITDESERTIGGFKVFYRVITGIPIKSDVSLLFDGGETGTSIV